MTASWVPFAHPTQRRLRSWLLAAGPVGDDRVSRHLDHCERCAARLGDLADDHESVAPPDEGALAAALEELYAPPDDLTGRVVREVGRSERADRDLELFIALFSVARDTAELMFPPRNRKDRP